MGLKHEKLTEKVIGAFFEVYNELGSGFLESVYENAMMIALRGSGLQCQQQAPVNVCFRGETVGEFRADILVEKVLILELQCAKAIDDSHVGQTLNYMKASGTEVGLVLNFGPKAEFRRLVL